MQGMDWSPLRSTIWSHLMNRATTFWAWPIDYWHGDHKIKTLHVWGLFQSKMVAQTRQSSKLVIQWGVSRYLKFLCRFSGVLSSEPGFFFRSTKKRRRLRKLDPGFSAPSKAIVPIMWRFVVRTLMAIIQFFSEPRFQDVSTIFSQTWKTSESTIGFRQLDGWFLGVSSWWKLTLQLVLQEPVNRQLGWGQGASYPPSK